MRKVQFTLLTFLTFIILAILLFSSICSSNAVFPRHSSITIDGNGSDWLGTPPSTQNLGWISSGEWIWTDASGDERADFTSPNPDSRVDMVEFRITSDGTYLFFYIEFTDIDIASGNGAPAVCIGIDNDKTTASGESWFGALTDTQIGNSKYYWEYQIITSFGPNGDQPSLFDSSWNDQTTSDEGQAISTTNDAIEIQVKLSTMGVSLPATLTFTVITFRQMDTVIESWDIFGTSDALDCITTTGPNTWDEVTDQSVDYSFEVYFGSNGDAENILLISELYPWATTGETEWIEIGNPISNEINLYAGNFKVGDEETKGGSEVMYSFPPGATIPAGGVAVIARDSTSFESAYGFKSDFEFEAHDALVPDMIQYSSWGLGSFLSLANTGDEGILLDGSDNIVDVCTYGSSGTVLGHTRFITAGSSGYSLTRTGATDTDDCNTDFELLENENPGNWPDNPLNEFVIPQIWLISGVLLIGVISLNHSQKR